MALAKIYDQVAQKYNKHISADILNSAYELAITAIIKEHAATPLMQVLSLGVGDGAFLLKLQEKFPQAQFTGLDISEKMLARAEQNLAIKTYHGNITAATSMLAPQKFNLILAHFVTAYVSLPVILQQIKYLQTDQAQISLMTNTLASFAHLQNFITECTTSYNPFKRIIAWYTHRVLKKVFVPKNNTQMQSTCQEQKFTIVANDTMAISITFNNADEMYKMFMEGGWFASAFDIKWSPSFLIEKLFKVATKRYLKFPFKDNIEISSMLLKKIN